MNKRARTEKFIVALLMVLIFVISYAGIYLPGKTYDSGYTAGFMQGYDKGAREIINTVSEGKIVDWTSSLDGWNGVIVYDHVETKRHIPLEDNPTCKVCHKYSTELYKERRKVS